MVGKKDGSTIAVIGANGFVGNSICRYLEAKCSRQNVLRLGRAGFDLNNPNSWATVDESVDCLVHAAASTTTDRYNLYNTNAISTGLLAEYCNSIGLKKMVYLSTGAVYGNIHGYASTETRCNPQTDYALSKYLAERRLVESFQGALVVLRLYFPYGPNQGGNRLLPRMIATLKRSQPVTCNPDGGPLLQLAHIDDVVSVIVEQFVNADAKSGYWNIASTHIYPIEEIAGLLAKQLSVQLELDRSGSSADVLSVPYESARWRPFAADALFDGE